MKNKIIWKLFGAYFLFILITVFVLNFFVGLKLRNYYEQKIFYRLKSNAYLIGDILSDPIKNKDLNFIDEKIGIFAKELEVRITVIDNAGKVLGDSDESSDLMENHNDRLEIVRAIKNGFGESNRFSDTLEYNMKYVAIPIRTDKDYIGIVRLALPLTEVETEIRFIYRIVLLGGVISIIMVVFIGYFISQRIVSPIKEMKEIAHLIASSDFSKRVEINSKDELGMLARSLNEMADQLQQRIDNLKNMDKMKTEFVANVSHELKTPLTSIKGFVETLEDGAMEDKETNKKFLAIIKRHTERLTNITNDLLSLSELESKKDVLSIASFDLKEMIDEIILGFGHAISEKTHKLKFASKFDKYVMSADKVKIEQVIVNLIDNAVKYTESGGEIKIEFTEDEKCVNIIVEDDGIGIPAKYFNRVFERFYRVDKARSRQSGGTGLGLAIVKHIVSLHGGNVQIESQVGIGTKIIVSLPR